jgi:L-arabinose isomerase
MAKVGQLGGAFPYMGDFAVDSTFLADSLGAQIVKLEFGEFFERCEDASSDSITELLNVYKDAYEISSDITPDELEQTARVEIAMRGLIADKNLSAITYLFSAFGDNDRSPTLPFVAASRLMADGVGFGGEGDVIGALGSYFLNEINCPASFSEIFTTDFARNSLFMSHMGEANVAMADGRIDLIARAAPITKTIYRQLALRFPLRTGEVTFFSLVQAGSGKWRAIASAMDIIEWLPVENIPCPQFKLVPRVNVRDWLTSYAKAGGPHHNAVCFGDARNRLKLAFEILGVEYIEI